MAQLLNRLWVEDQAEGLFEYALLLLLISMTAVSTMGGLASTVSNYYSGATARVEATSRGGRLAGGSIDYGVQNSTDTEDFSADSTNLNTK